LMVLAVVIVVIVMGRMGGIHMMGFEY